MVEGVWHASFTVSDIKRSIQFYTEVIGLELVHEQTQHNEYTSRLVGYQDVNLNVAMFTIPGQNYGPSGHILELIQYIKPMGIKIDTETCNTGTAHFAFLTTDIHSEVTRMKHLGVRFKTANPVEIEAGRNKGGYSIYFLDPDDITLELFQPPSMVQ